MLLVDPGDGDIVAANEAACRFYGYSEKELSRMSITQINMLPPDEVHRRRQQALAGQEQHFVFPHRMADGEIRMVDVESSPLQVGDRALLLSIVREATMHVRSDLLQLVANTVQDILSGKGSASTELIEGVMDRVRELFAVDDVALFEWSGEKSARLTHWVTVNDVSGPTDGIAVDDGSPLIARLMSGSPVAFGSLAELPDEIAAGVRERQGWDEQSMLAVPMMVDDTFTGFITLNRRRARRRWDDDEVDVLRIIAGALAQAIAGANAQEQLRLGAETFRTAREGIMMLDGDTRILDVNPGFTRITGYSLGEAVGRRPADLLGSGRHPASFYEQMMRALAERGTWSGDLWSRNKVGDLYRERLTITTIRGDDGAISHMIAIMDDVTSLQRQQEQLEYARDFDALTGLPNRQSATAQLQTWLDQSEVTGTRGTLIIIGIHDLSRVNESLGHSMGDHLLTAAATRVAQAAGADDVVARFGGGEFLVISARATTEEKAEALCRRLLDHIDGPVPVPGGGVVLLTASAGATLIPDGTPEAATALQRADAARRAAKQEGPGGVAVATDSQLFGVREAFELEAALKSAVDADELEVWYQPKFRVSDGVIAGVEALLRWTLPDGSVVPPSTFIPMAERLGLIQQLGLRVLTVACHQGSEWIAEGRPPLRIAVNISPRQAHDATLPGDIEEILRESGFPATSLELELTESTLTDQAGIGPLLELMTTLGIQMAIDDFGTGYSSFSLLRDLPVDRLKIDRTFVRNLTSDQGDRTILGAMIAMAHALGAPVTAEGVETDAQLDSLRTMGCDEFQGFLRSAAVTADGLTRLLSPTAQD